VLLVTAPVMLAYRFRGDPRWRGLSIPLTAAAAASAGLLAVFYATPQNSWDATLQRIAVTLPLAAIVAVAARLVATAGSPADAASAGRAPVLP
jgi:hypothetical protein